MKQFAVFSLLAVLFLAGCQADVPATSEPSPVPTRSQAYDPEVPGPDRDAIIAGAPRKIRAYEEFTPPDWKETVSSLSVSLVSAGDEIITRDIDINGNTYRVDTIWVYERNLDVSLYPLAVGIDDGEIYHPLSSNILSEETPPVGRDAYLAYLLDNGLIERGRSISASLSSLSQTGFLSSTGIDWSRCDESDFLCVLGKEMSSRYQMDDLFFRQFFNRQRMFFVFIDTGRKRLSGTCQALHGNRQ